MSIEAKQFIILTLWARLLDAGFLRRTALCSRLGKVSEKNWSFLDADDWREHLEPCLSEAKRWPELRNQWARWLDSNSYRNEIQRDYEEGSRALYFNAKGYPKAFLEIDDPPPVIFAKGCLSLLDDADWTINCVTIVGTRRPSSYGERCAQRLSERLAEVRVKIVSGLAYGIDVIAQNTAVRRGGICVAVLASPLNRIYPRAHRGLSTEIERGGLLLTERATGAELRTYHFPMRNRLMSALGRCCVVIEAGRSSGSLITAKLGLDQGKDIWALPGRIDCPESQGCNDLIENGAYPLTDFDTFIDWLGSQGVLGKASKKGGGTERLLSPETLLKRNDAAFLCLSRNFGPELPQRLLDSLAEADQSAESLAWKLRIDAAKLFELLAECEELGLLSFIQGAYRRLV